MRTYKCICTLLSKHILQRKRPIDPAGLNNPAKIHNPILARQPYPLTSQTAPPTGPSALTIPSCGSAIWTKKNGSSQ